MDVLYFHLFRMCIESSQYQISWNLNGWLATLSCPSAEYQLNRIKLQIWWMCCSLIGRKQIYVALGGHQVTCKASWATSVPVLVYLAITRLKDKTKRTLEVRNHISRSTMLWSLPDLCLVRFWSTQIGQAILLSNEFRMPKRGRRTLTGW